jgi:hypothetical protein
MGERSKIEWTGHAFPVPAPIIFLRGQEPEHRVGLPRKWPACRLGCCPYCDAWCWQAQLGTCMCIPATLDPEGWPGQSAVPFFWGGHWFWLFWPAEVMV